jgi:anti-sigma factor (TIGR02949 family)
MSSAARQHACHEYTSLLGSFLDGELDASGMHELESHVERCAPCGEQVELLRATRVTLKRIVHKPAPSGLRGRLSIAMAAEAVRGDAREANAAEQITQRAAAKLIGWRTMVPLATAAALALMWGAATHSPMHAMSSKEHTAGFDLLSELLAEHSQPLPPEATDSKSVRNLSKYIGVPVRPTSFEKGGAHLIGGRVVGASDRRAAVLQYMVMNGDGPRRVSVLVYDPSRIQVNGPADLSPRAVGTAQVEVGHAKGYSVALAQRAGVGYAFASDLDMDTSAQFAANAYDE